MSKSAAKILLAGVLVLLSAGVYGAYGFWAYHPSDDGVVLGMAWRVAGGEVPYRDFIFLRPPLSAYLHSLWMLLPAGSQFLAARLGFYLQISLTVLLPAWWALGRGLFKMGVANLCLVATAWFLALHIFPPMPWTTVDGVMLGYGGLVLWLYALDRGRGPAAGLGLRFAAGLCFGLAALCKQNFAVLPAWYLGATGLETLWGWRGQGRLTARLAAGAGAALLPLVLIAGVLLWLLHAAGALEPFYHQVIQSHFHGYLGTYGFATYMTSFKRLLAGAAAIILVALAYRYLPRTRRWWPVAVLVAVLLGVAGMVFYTVWILDPYDQVSMGAKWALGLVAGAGAWVLWVMRRGSEQDFWPAAVLCSGVVLLGWSASLSIGWNTPLLGLGGSGAVLAMAHDRAVANRAGRRLAAAAALVCLLVVAGSFLAFNYQHPYMDQPRAALTSDLAEVYPRFGRLYSNPCNHARHAALAATARDLTRRYPGVKLVVVGEFPLFHYLSGTRNPTSIDWWNPWEYAGCQDRLRRDLEQPGLLIILDNPRRYQDQGCFPQRPGKDKMKTWIRRRFPLLGCGRFFCVYGRPPGSGQRRARPAP